MKIDTNPFAKGFRDSTRLPDVSKRFVKVVWWLCWWRDDAVDDNDDDDDDIDDDDNDIDDDDDDDRTTETAPPNFNYKPQPLSSFPFYPATLPPIHPDC